MDPPSHFVMVYPLWPIMRPSSERERSIPLEPEEAFVSHTSYRCHKNCHISSPPTLRLRLVAWFRLLHLFLIPYPEQSIAGSICFISKHCRHLSSREDGYSFAHPPISSASPHPIASKKERLRIVIASVVERTRRCLFTMRPLRTRREGCRKREAVVGLPTDSVRYWHQEDGTTTECNRQ